MIVIQLISLIRLIDGYFKDHALIDDYHSDALRCGD